MSVPVQKTYKLYVGGKFPRSESGRVYQPLEGGPNVARASQKDVRDAVAAAQKGGVAWASVTPYLRGQILYRLAEMLESRREAMVQELVCGGTRPAAAQRELDVAASLCTWYAGLCDKLQSLLGSHNAVSGPFCSFSTVEPVGVVGVVAPERPALVGALALLLPALVGGNSVVVGCSEAAPFAGLALGEVCASSDVPAGAVNILSGPRDELGAQLARHRGVDGLLLAGALRADWSRAAADNCKRVRYLDLPDAAWRSLARLRSLQFVEAFVEVKTLWHPVAP